MQRRLRNKCVSVLVCLSMALTLLSTPLGSKNVKAEEPANEQVKYLYYEWNSTTDCLDSHDGTVEEYEKITDSSTSIGGGKWYVVSGEVTVDSKITVSGVANLILADGCNLTVNGGINVEGANTLNIYAQSEGDNCGKLTATGFGRAGIGGGANGAGGKVTINGGTVTATGSGGGAGIGGENNAAGGNVTINGGTVTATGVEGGAGIGGGFMGADVTVTINGGTVKATGVNGGAGIGGGFKGAGGTVTINGGTVIATGGVGGAGIQCDSLTISDNLYVQCNGEYIKDTTRSLDGDVFIHKHDNWSVTGENNVLTYSCGIDGCEQNGVPFKISLKLAAPGDISVYTGNAYECTINIDNPDAWNKSGYESEPEIIYESLTANVNLEEDKPVNAGLYKASISADGATVQITFEIAKADQPSQLSADTFEVTDDSCVENATGFISGVTSAMEYSKENSESWTPCPEGTITGLEAGSYSIRLKGNNNYLTGDAVTVTVNTASHVYSTEYTVDKPASCTEAGEESRHCTVTGCNSTTDRRTIKAKGHQLKTEAAVAANCTENGHKEYYQCTVCGKYFADNDCKNAISDIAAWLEGNGLNVKTGHSFDTVNWSTDENSHWHAAICGDTDEVLDKAAHTWNEGRVTKIATVAEAGEKTFTCVVCNRTKTEVIPKLTPTPEVPAETPEVPTETPEVPAETPEVPTGTPAQEPTGAPTPVPGQVVPTSAPGNEGQTGEATEGQTGEATGKQTGEVTDKQTGEATEGQTGEKTTDEKPATKTELKQQLTEIFTENKIAVTEQNIDSAVSVTKKDSAYYDENGKKITSSFIKTDDGKYRYVGTTGKSVKRAVIATNDAETGEVKMYYAGKNGVIVKDKVVTLPDGGKIFASEDGTLATNELVTSGKHQYYAGKDGKLLTNQIIKLEDGTRYYVNKYGYIRKNALITAPDGDRRYATADGTLAKSCWVTVGKKMYWCNKIGRITESKSVK